MTDALEMTTLEKLGRPLDGSRVRQREGGNGRSLSYLETHDVIRTANDIFGFGGWGHEIVELRELPGVTVTREGKAGSGFQVGYLCVVRLTVTGCVPVSGVGYGDAIEYRDTAPVTAHELAAKEAESDALKRALKNYGDQFGLALYDKQAASAGHVTNGGNPVPVAASHESAAANGVAADGGWRWQSGKNEGKTLAETDRGYVEWYAANGPKADVRALCTDWLAAPSGADSDIPF